MAKSRRKPGSDAMMEMSAVAAEVRSASVEWEFGDTPLSSLSAQDAASYLGLTVDPLELAATEDAVKSATVMASFMAFGAPSAVDWRSNGGNFVTGIKNQASCGSCVAFATIATIEARMNIACRSPGNNRDYSEAFLFYCGCGNCCGTGWNFVPALTFCQARGFAAEASFPYTPGNQPCRPGVAVIDRITGFGTHLSAADRKNAIATGGPVVAGMAVYQDFMGYRGGVYRHVSGGLAGYHAVSVVGYNDTQGCWIAKNSWGTGWGESGFFRIAYGQCGMDTQFAMYSPGVRSVQPTDQCAHARPMLVRVIQAAQANPRLRACLRHHVCRRGARPICGPGELAIAQLVLRILGQCPQFRAPFCAAMG